MMIDASKNMPDESATPDPGCRLVALTELPIDVQRLVDRVRSPAAGAVVLFLGTVREVTAGRKSVALQYEAYASMAEAELTRLASEAQQQWDLCQYAVVHRVGHLRVGEISVAVALSAAHRRAAFEAGQWLIDRIKQTVPIWKQERYADGTAEWVHPRFASEEVRKATPRPHSPDSMPST